MFALLLLICFALIFLTFKRIFSSRDLREIFLLSALTWGVLATFGTELLSLFKLITFKSFLVFWGTWIFILMIVLLFLPKHRIRPLLVHFPKLSGFEIGLLTTTVAIVILIGLIASLSPPNNYDSMVYHIARIPHWIQNSSIANYPTHILWQLNMNPWAEFALLHLQILAEGDHFANLVQWFSMIGSIIGATLIAKQFRLNAKGQIATAVLAATLPIGILQGSSTQNDYVMTFWLVCFIYFVLQLTFDLRLIYTMACGASLGLCFLTKGTGYIFAVPFIAWLIIDGLKRHKLKFLTHLLLIGFIVLSLNLGFYARNIDLYQNILSPLPRMNGTTNEIFSFGAFSSNLIQNISLNLTTPNKYTALAAQYCTYALLAILNLNIADPRICWGGMRLNLIENAQFQYHEDFAGNFLHLILTGLLILFFIKDKDLKKNHLLWKYLGSIIVGIGLFCLFIKWTPWSTRYHLAGFVLLAPFCATVLLKTRKNRMINTVCVILLVATIPWIFLNKKRPVLAKENIFNISRQEQYFFFISQFADPYLNAAKIMPKTCSEIGLTLDDFSLEYPLWIFLKKENPNVRIEHIDVTNPSSKYKLKGFDPCVIIDISAGKEFSELRLLAKEDKLLYEN